MVKHITITCHGQKQSTGQTKLSKNVSVKFYTADGCSLTIVKAEAMWASLCQYGKESYEKGPNRVKAVETFEKSFKPTYICWLDYFAGVYFHSKQNSLHEQPWWNLNADRQVREKS